MRPARLALVIGLSGLGSLACSGGATGPGEGILNLEFQSPTNDDGAVMFTISGGPIDSVESEGRAVYSAAINATTTRVVITGDLRSGTLARITIPDRDQASHYAAAVEQVAHRSSYAQRDPAGYGLRLTP